MKALLLLLAASLPLKLWPAVEPEMTVVATEQREGYTCQLVEYNVPDGDRVQSYLLVPDTATAKSPRPGLVLLHDHGARFDIGKEKLVKPLADAPDYIKVSAAEWVADGFDGVYFGDRLAQEGFVVIVPDVLYWGSRSSEKCREWSRTRSKALKKEVYEGQRAVYDSLQRKGIVWAEKTLNEDAAAARLLSPKPFLFLIGTTDKLFPREATQEAFERMQAIYRENGAAGALRTEFFEGGHHCGLREQQTIIHFFEHD